VGRAKKGGKKPGNGNNLVERGQKNSSIEGRNTKIGSEQLQGEGERESPHTNKPGL